MKVLDLKPYNGILYEIEAAKILDRGGLSDDIHYAPIVCHAQDYLSNCMTDEDIKGKDVLTTIGSGDYLTWILGQEPNSVATFDINVLASYYQNLKIAGILSMTIHEYIDFFFNNHTFFDKYHLLQLTKLLPENEKLFWDKLILPMSKEQIAESGLFKRDCPFYNLSNSLLLEENYYKVREMLKERYYCNHVADFKTCAAEMAKYGRTFDTIFVGKLSSVGLYKNAEEAISNIQDIATPILNEDGAVIATLTKDNSYICIPRRS